MSPCKCTDILLNINDLKIDVWNMSKKRQKHVLIFTYISIYISITHLQSPLCSNIFYHFRCAVSFLHWLSWSAVQQFTSVKSAILINCRSRLNKDNCSELLEKCDSMIMDLFSFLTMFAIIMIV